MKREYVPWKNDEKDLFWQNVQQFEAQNRKINFTQIARNLRTKTARQCYDFYNLNKDKHEQESKRHEWTEEEEDAVYQFVRENGPDWNELMKIMPEFTFQELKNRYYVICKRKESKQCKQNEEKIINEVSKILGNE